MAYFAILPTELIERILLSCASAGDPGSISALAQTDRRLRGMVYAPADQHLWRAIYLATFDDPRMAFDQRYGPGETLRRSPNTSVQLIHRKEDDGPDGEATRDAVDWGTAYRMRVRAGRVTTRETPASVMSFLRAARGAILHSATHVPTAPSAGWTPIPTETDYTGAFVRAITSHPLFPTPFPSISCSRDIEFLQRLMHTRSLPSPMPVPPSVAPTRRLPDLLSKLGSPSWDAPCEHFDPHFSRRPGARAYYELLAHFGPTVLERRLGRASGLERQEELTFFVETTPKRKTLRRAARAMIYDIRYLERRRHWAPFKPVLEATEEPDPGEPRWEEVETYSRMSPVTMDVTSSSLPTQTVERKETPEPDSDSSLRVLADGEDTSLADLATAILAPARTRAEGTALPGSSSTQPAALEHAGSALEGDPARADNSKSSRHTADDAPTEGEQVVDAPADTPHAEDDHDAHAVFAALAAHGEALAAAFAPLAEDAPGEEDGEMTDSDDDEDEDDDDEPDADFMPGTMGSTDSESSDEDDNEGPFAALPALLAEIPLSAARTPPPADALEPDWTWLAAARVVVEANLREVATLRAWERDPWNGDDVPAALVAEMGPTGEDDEAATRRQTLMRGIGVLMDAEGVRSGSAGVSEVPDLGECTAGLTFDDGVEDWAGATGVWRLAIVISLHVEALTSFIYRRCVCWLDYRDLVGTAFCLNLRILAHINLVNQSRLRVKRYMSRSLGEAVRIMPVAIRVVGIDTSAPCIWPTRPPLRIIGAAAGPDPNSPLRKTRGSVQMTGDGRVRWTLVSLPCLKRRAGHSSDHR
jgi:hypothetical protein